MNFIKLFLFILFLVTTSLEAVKNDDTTLTFTQEELQWIKDHPVIRVANEEDWPPFDYVEYNKPKGMAIDYVNLLSKKIKVTFQNISNNPVRDVRLKLEYVSGSSEELVYEKYIGDVFSGDAISLGDAVNVVIDRSQLTDGIFIYTWLVELNTYDGSQILDEILIEKIE